MDKQLSKHFKNHNLLTNKKAETIGIRRHELAFYVKEGQLERVERGIYSLPNEWVDDFEILQIKNEKVIYSFGTALYFHDLSDKAPSTVHITVPQGYNTSHITKSNKQYRIHYVQKEYLEIGVETIKSPQGGLVKVYDKERSLCDIIKNKNSVDTQIFKDSIRNYFNHKERDTVKLLKYSKLFNIESEVRNYIEMLG